MKLEEIGEGPARPSEGFLQSAFWGAFKAEFGWRPLRIAADCAASHNASRNAASPNAPATPGAAPAEAPVSLLVLLRRLGGGYSFAYLPHGPELPQGAAGDARLLAGIGEALRPRLPRGCLFVRFDPPWYLAEPAASGGEDEGRKRQDPDGLRPQLGKPLVRAASDVQPPDTVLLDLGPGEDALLAAMKPKWRYNIRLAEKKGVTVAQAGASAMGEFYRLYRTTAARDRIALHPEGYYARLFSLAEEWKKVGGGSPGDAMPDFRLWLAVHEGETLAAIITLFRGSRAVYLYGASSDEKRNLMPAYALQWAAIRAAKAAGCREYDFFGIPPDDDPGHPMAGLYRFKTGFGGRIVHRAGSWDYPLKPFAYALFRAAESARAWWFKDFRKRFGRRGE